MLMKPFASNVELYFSAVKMLCSVDAKYLPHSSTHVIGGSYVQT